MSVDLETLWRLVGIVVQGCIVVLAISSAAATFLLGFVWEHFAQAKRLESCIDRISNKEMPVISSMIAESRKQIIELYKSYFDLDYESFMGFYDMLISSYPLVARINKLQRVVRFLCSLLPILPGRFGKTTRLLARIVVLLVLIWPIRRWFEIYWEGARVVRNTALEISVRVRVTREQMRRYPKTGFWVLLALGILRSSLKAISSKKGEVYSSDRLGLDFEIDLGIMKDDVEIRDWMKHEVANWAANRELMDVIPSASTFPIDLRSIDRADFGVFRGKVEVKQQTLNRAKACYMPEDWQGKIQNAKKNYNLSLKERADRLSGQLAEPKENLSKLAFFIKSKGRTQLKALIFLIMASCGTGIILGLTTVAIASAKPAVGTILAYFSTTLLISAVALLVILVTLFLRRL